MNQGTLPRRVVRWIVIHHLELCLLRPRDKWRNVPTPPVATNSEAGKKISCNGKIDSKVARTCWSSQVWKITPRRSFTILTKNRYQIKQCFLPWLSIVSSWSNFFSTAPVFRKICASYIILDSFSQRVWDKNTKKSSKQLASFRYKHLEIEDAEETNVIFVNRINLYRVWLMVICICIWGEGQIKPLHNWRFDTFDYSTCWWVESINTQPGLNLWATGLMQGSSDGTEMIHVHWAVLSNERHWDDTTQCSRWRCGFQDWGIFPPPSETRAWDRCRL